MAQKGYRDFVQSLVGHAYESPLTKASATLVLGSTEFVRQVKNRYLNDRTNSRDIPALRQIQAGIGMASVLDLVTTGVIENYPAQVRNASIYLCRKHTGEKLRTIGKQFGISDAAVSQVCKRFGARIERDMLLKREIVELEKRIVMLKVET